jgi:hypothetical protein
MIMCEDSSTNWWDGEESAKRAYLMIVDLESMLAMIRINVTFKPMQ